MDMPRTNVSQARRAQIIQAAMACFARQGYHSTTMDDIARESGLSKGALYWYFPSKADLFLTILDVWMDEQDRVLKTQAGEDASVAERLAQWIAAFTRFVQEEPARVQLIKEFWAEVPRSEELNQRLGRRYLERIHRLEEIIQRGIERGELRSQDTQAAAQTILAMYDGFLLQQMLLPDLFSWERVNRMAVEMISQGLLAPPVGGRDVGQR